MPTAHETIRQVCESARRVVSKVPSTARSGSPRQLEASRLLASSGDGDKVRSELLSDLNVDAQVMAANLSIIVDGVADCLEVAAGRDNAVNAPVLSINVRPALEVAGQLAWLLADDIDGDERARRFLRWRFDDLKQQRLLMHEFASEDADTQDVVRALDQSEADLIDRAECADWQAQKTRQNSGSIEAAALLDGGKRQGVPKKNEMALLVARTPSVYSLLSIPAHGVRFGAMSGMHTATDPSGQQVAHVRGFGIAPNVAIGLSMVAVDTACRLLAGWNGVDATALHADVMLVMGMAGII